MKIIITEQQFKKLSLSLRDSFTFGSEGEQMKEIIQENKIFPSSINTIIKKILKEWSLSQYFDLIKNNIEFLPLIGNLINWSAKIIDSNYYDDKEIIISFLTQNHPRTWSDSEQGIVYSETPYGQVSFHVFNDEVDDAKQYGISNQDREWSGEPM